MHGHVVTIMTPERWQQIEKLYHSTLEREDSQRASFLKEACAGDEVVRREVESLLAYQPQAESFTEVPALEVVLMRWPRIKPHRW